jgi:hypothetical protein
MQQNTIDSATQKVESCFIDILYTKYQYDRYGINGCVVNSTLTDLYSIYYLLENLKYLNGRPEVDLWEFPTTNLSGKTTPEHVNPIKSCCNVNSLIEKTKILCHQ